MNNAGAGNTEAQLRQRLQRARHDREALSQLVGLLIERHDYLQAAQHLARLSDCCPELPGVRLDSARLWLKAGRPRDAVGAATAALAAGADPFEAQCVLAEAAERGGDSMRAIHAYRAAIALHPELGALYNNLGLLLRDTGDTLGAIAAFTAALERAAANIPAAVSALNNRGNTWRQVGRFEEAADDYARALALDPAHALTHYNRGLVQLQLNQAPDAVASFRSALSCAPEATESNLQMIEALLAGGDFSAAASTLDQFLAQHPQHARGWYLRATLARQPLEISDTLDVLRTLRREPSLTAAERSEIDFALGDLLDRSDQCDEAFRAYRAANRHRREQVSRVQRQQTLRVGQRMLTTPLDAWVNADATNDADPVPLFIIGMPRSGTTLLEQLLGAHPSIAPAGEADYFGAALHWLQLQRFPSSEGAASNDWRPGPEARQALREGYGKRLQLLANVTPETTLIIDKTPLNFLYVGLLQSLYPTAKFLHCRRDAMDTCLSIYFQQFGSLEFTHDLDDIADVFLNYRALMQHWQGISGLQMLDVDYEQLVAEPERVVHGILAFLDLAWDPRCGSTESSARTINTASRWQARQPIYQHARQRWQRYARPLAGLARRLGT